MQEISELVLQDPRWLWAACVVVLIGWWTRDVVRWGVRHPASYFLERLRREERRVPVLRAVRAVVRVIPSLAAAAAIMASGIVLAQPVEKTRFEKKTATRREAACIFDVSGSITREPEQVRLLTEVCLRFAREWQKRYPDDVFSAVAFADMATAFGTSSSDIAVLERNLRDAERLMTNYGGGTHLERGLYAGLMALAHWTPLEAARVEGVLRRREIDDIGRVRPHLKSELASCRRRGGGAALIFTDGIVQLKPQAGMAPPLVLIALLGECRIVPFFFSTDHAGAESEVQAALARAVRQYGGKDYLVSALAGGDIKRMLDDIVPRVPPRTWERQQKVIERARSDLFARSALAAVLFVMGAFLWKTRKEFPWIRWKS